MPWRLKHRLFGWDYVLARFGSQHRVHRIIAYECGGVVVKYIETKKIDRNWAKTHDAIPLTQGAKVVLDNLHD